MTYVVQIGNSDDKLSQAEWSAFAFGLICVIERAAEEIHFKGGSDVISRYQNYCIVFELRIKLKELKERLISLAEMYGQDSIALTSGKTVFLRSKNGAA